MDSLFVLPIRHSLRLRSSLFHLHNTLSVCALIICGLLLSACNVQQEASSSAQYAATKPSMLRAIDNSQLSVIVRIDNSATDYTGEQRADGQWIVRLDIELDMSHTFVASWFARVNGENVLLMEQSGEFFASSTSMMAQTTATPISSGATRFDVDCDGMSNLFEVENDSDPSTDPGCDSVSTAQNSAANVIADAAEDFADAVAIAADDASPAPSSSVPDVVDLQAGCYLMGNVEYNDNPDLDGFYKPDQRQHQVCVEAFSIGRYEVTFDQYAAFADSPGILEDVPGDLGWGKGSRPVRDVTWREAVAYTDWLSEQTNDVYRLPTEAEWEYAARGGEPTRFWTGNTLRDDQEHFKSSDPWGGGIATGQPDRDKSRPVGSLQPNPYGLYDMLGNLVEHTCSEYSEDYSGGLENECGDPNAAHVTRGGAYNLIGSWSHVYHRTVTVEPNKRNGHIGFRVVRVNP